MSCWKVLEPTKEITHLKTFEKQYDKCVELQEEYVE